MLSPAGTDPCAGVETLGRGGELQVPAEKGLLWARASPDSRCQGAQMSGKVPGLCVSQGARWGAYWVRGGGPVRQGGWGHRECGVLCL